MLIPARISSELVIDGIGIQLPIADVVSIRRECPTIVIYRSSPMVLFRLQDQADISGQLPRERCASQDFQTCMVNTRQNGYQTKTLSTGVEWSIGLSPSVMIIIRGCIARTQ